MTGLPLQTEAVLVGIIAALVLVVAYTIFFMKMRQLYRDEDRENEELDRKCAAHKRSLNKKLSERFDDSVYTYRGHRFYLNEK